MQALLEENLILRFLFVFLFSVIMMKFWKRIAYKLNLIDKPDHRKKHTGAIPLVGGICVYSAIFITALLLGRPSIELFSYLAAAGALVITGALDDRFDISAKTRLLIEAIAAVIMIFGAGVYVGNLGNLFGLGDITITYGDCSSVYGFSRCRVYQCRQYG